MSLTDRIKRSWNAFRKREENPEQISYGEIGRPSYIRPGRSYTRLGNDRSIISSIITRIGIDVAAIDLLHVRNDENGRYLETMKSGLNDCLVVEANIDQGGRAFRQDVAMSLLEQGVIAVVPVDTSDDPDETGSYDIYTLRVGRIVSWHPKHITVEVYDERDGERKEILVSKRSAAIFENPLYSVMNEPNSTLQRLTRKLNLLDIVDEQSSSGKLDLIIQLPYVIKSEARRNQAEVRRKDIENQLQGSKYGIAYTDGTEKITQLNRPAENNMFTQVEYLTNMLYGQLGITEDILNGTASEETTLVYYNRTVEPILAAMAESFKRSFLTKTARSQGQSIEYYRDPFRLVPIGKFAELADKLTRNEIATANELRSAIGMKPSTEAKADMLVNSNMPVSEAAVETDQTDALGEVESALDEVFSDLEDSLDGT